MLRYRISVHDKDVVFQIREQSSAWYAVTDTRQCLVTCLFASSGHKMGCFSSIHPAIDSTCVFLRGRDNLLDDIASISHTSRHLSAIALQRRAIATLLATSRHLQDEVVLCG